MRKPEGSEPRPALRQREDDAQLEYAASAGRVLYSFNMGHFQEIHTRWLSSGRTHAGLILARQKRFSVGEQIRRLVHLTTSLTAEEMRDRVEFLRAW